jgi:hypothetical protein
LRANIGESKCAELTDGSVLFVGNPGRGTRRVLTIITEGGTKNATKLWHAGIKHAGCQGAVARHSWPKDGKPGILLYSGPGIEKARARGTLRASYDDGKTWPWKQEYYQGPSGYSDDRGETWKVGGICRHGQLAVESSGVELCDGSLLFNGRTNQRSGARVMSILPDGGTDDSTKYWDAEDLPRSNCQGAIVRHSWPTDGKPGLILFSGQGDAVGGGSLVGSYDDGKTWTWRGMYYEGPTVYRDIAVLGDGRVIALFEKDGKNDLGFVIAPAPPATPPATPPAEAAK